MRDYHRRLATLSVPAKSVKFNTHCSPSYARWEGGKIELPVGCDVKSVRSTDRGLELTLQHSSFPAVPEGEEPPPYPWWNKRT